MNLNDLFSRSQIVTDTILGYLDAKSLAYFGSCCHKWRSFANSNSLWLKICKRQGYSKFGYLIDYPNHQLIPTQSTSATPIYQQIESKSLQFLVKWREVYNRAEHLIKNWRNGIYFVAPVLRGHNGKITSFDSNGSTIASGSKDDKLIKIWSVDDFDCLNTIKIKSDSFNCLKIYNEFVIAGGDEGVIQFYGQLDGDLKHVIKANNSDRTFINKMAIFNDTLIAVLEDKSIKGWSLKTYEILFILRGHEDEVESFHSYENFLVTGSWDKSIILWDLTHGSKLAKLNGHSEVVNCVRMKENTIISASSDSTIRIWNLEIQNSKNSGLKMSKSIVNLAEAIVLEGHSSDIYCLEVYKDYIVSGGADSVIIVWKLDGSLLFKLSGHLGIVRFLYIDEFKLVSGGDAKKIMVWDYKNGVLLNTLYRNPSNLNYMFVNDTKIITASPETISNITIICYW